MEWFTARFHPIIVGYVFMILLDLSVLTIGYTVDSIEGEDLSFDINSSRAQIRHYGTLHSGSIMAKSIQFEVTDAKGDKKMQRRLVAYDLDPIFPPYDNVYEDLVIKEKMSQDESNDALNHKFSLDEGLMSNELLGDDENIQQSDLVDGITLQVDEMEEKDAHYHATDTNVEDTGSRDSIVTESTEEYEISDSIATESNIIDLISEDDIIKETVATGDNVSLDINSKESEMQVVAEDIDDTASQTADLENIMTNSESDTEVEMEASVASSGEEVTTNVEDTSKDTHVSDIMDDYNKTHIEHNDAQIDTKSEIDASIMSDDKAEKSGMTSLPDKNNEREEQRNMDEDSILPNDTLSDDTLSLVTVNDRDRNDTVTNNVEDDNSVENIPFSGVGQTDEDPENEMEGQELGTTNERGHHDDFPYYRIHNDEFVEATDKTLPNLTNGDSVDLIASQKILLEAEASRSVKSEPELELDKDVPSYAVSTGSDNNTLTVGIESEAHETMEVPINDASRESSSGALNYQEEASNPIAEREDNFSDELDDKLLAKDVVNESNMEGDMGTVSMDLGPTSMDLDRTINNGIIGAHEEEVNTDEFYWEIAEPTYENFDDVENSKESRNASEVVGLNVIKETNEASDIQPTDHASDIQPEANYVGEIESYLSLESIDSGNDQIRGEDIDPIKMADIDDAESITDSYISHETDNQEDEDNGLPINLSSPKPTANDEFVRGLDDLHKFLEEVDPPDELDVGASGLSIQEVLLGQGVTIIRTRVQKSLEHLQRSLRILKSKGTNQWNKLKDIIDDNFDINVEEAALSAVERMEKPYQKVKNFVSQNREKLVNVTKAFKFVSNFKSLFSRLHIINDDNDDEDYISFDDLEIKDDDLAEMRRKIMQRYE